MDATTTGRILESLTSHDAPNAPKPTPAICILIQEAITFLLVRVVGGGTEKAVGDLSPADQGEDRLASPQSPFVNELSRKCEIL